MVPIWVSDPMGLAMPLRTASTPATNVVATAPMPGIMMPSLPLGAWISLLEDFGSVFVLAFFGRVGMFKLLPHGLWECEANRYVLVLSQHLQPRDQRMAAEAT